MPELSFSSIRPSGHFKGKCIGTPFPLLKICWNTLERRSHCWQKILPLLLIERSLVRLPAGALSSQLGQLSLPSLQG